MSKPPFPLQFLVLTLLCAASVFAQLETGTIQGTLTDESGGVVPMGRSP